MYKLLLCLRYLRTRWIALASIISVMLGVATMIVVNSVMSGFKHEMYNRLHGILSDIVIESHSLEGFVNVPWYQDSIRKVVGDDLAGMTTTVHVPAMLSFQVRQKWVTRQVNLIGIDEETYAQVGDFSKYLLHPENCKQLGFQLREDGYDKRLPYAGWGYRRERVAFDRSYQEQLEQQRRIDAQNRPQQQLPQDPFRSRKPGQGIGGETNSAGDDPANRLVSGLRAADTNSPANSPAAPPANAPEDANAPGPVPPVHPPDLDQLELGTAAETLARTGDQAADETGRVMDEMKEQSTGIILGIMTCSFRDKNADGEVQDFFLCLPGDDVKITLPTAGTPPKAVSATFTTVDLYESKMSEYDGTFAFVPLRKLQELRGMIDPASGQGAVTSIQLKLREGADLNQVRDRLRAAFPASQFAVKIQTWRDMQGPLLAAVQMETTILNILLFLIIAVAGFGILATFFMIVVEKTRDIGILKSLGAPSHGVMSIFLGYGLSLGVVGSGVGMVLGLLFVVNINRIARVLEYATGQPVFDPTVYYFSQIPTIINPLTVAWIVAGAMGIAVLASVLPALRAARLHPVEALRYE